MNSKPFESDLVKLYSDFQAKIAEAYYKNDSGLVQETSMRDDNVTTKDIAKHKLIASEEKKLIKQGYLHIKEKIKNVRQDYRNAVVQGRRSGSGKFVHDYCFLLKELWGGSPAANCIQNAHTSLDNDHPIEKESGSSQEPLEEVKYAEDGEILDNGTNVES